MGDFTADWLDQRETLDQAARNRRLLQRLLIWRAQQEELRIADLGTGAGANFRFLAPQLGGRQRWIAVDQDTELLESLRPYLQRWAAAVGLEIDQQVFHSLNDHYQIESRQLDLASDLDELAFRHLDLITASALLDLVSKEWIDALAVRCHSAGAAVFMTLSYDGNFCWQPPDRDDDKVRRLVNRHQRTDKGFGPALGPQAASYLAKALKRLGYRVYLGRSDWFLDAAQAPLQWLLAKGYGQAAKAIEPSAAPWVEAWLARRRESIAKSELTVGHVDLFAHL